MILEDLGFKALASTSAGFAWSQARPDNAIARGGILDHLSALVNAVDNVFTLGLSSTTLMGLGVRRVSVGGALARNAYDGLWQVAKCILETGEFDISKPASRAGVALNPLFAHHRAGRGHATE